MIIIIIPLQDDKKKFFRIIKKIFYERRAYESVDEKSLS